MLSQRRLEPHQIDLGSGADYAEVGRVFEFLLKLLAANVHPASRLIEQRARSRTIIAGIAVFVR
jgi:hypothetical protein